MTLDTMYLPPRRTRRRQLAIALTLLTLAPALVAAQSRVSVKAGLSYNVSSDDGLAPGATQRSGFTIGIGVVSGGPVGFGVEALYAQRGFTSSVLGSSRRLDYLDIPFYVRLIAPLGEIAPFAYVGPQVSFELRCDGNGGNCPDSGRPKSTFAGVIGGGLRFATPRALSLEARYVYGLTDLKLGTVGSTSSYKSRSLLLLAGIGF